MKNKISFKLFIVTSIFILIVMGISFFLQTVSFQNFYTNKKMKTLKTNLSKFKTDYSKNSDNENYILNVMLQFEEKNNAKIVIITSNGALKYINNYSNNGNDIRKISIINKLINEWTSDPNVFNRIKNSGRTISYIYNTPDYQLKNIAIITPVKLTDNTIDVIFMVSSLQPVNEAGSVIKEFYFYFFIIAIIFIIILSFLYSNMISKPLLKLNDSASRIASLDFSAKCEVKRNDEIGSLAKTLNFLSDNLHAALTELKRKNKKLEEDIKKEKNLEIMRKDFVAGVSHELKTPISLIEGYAEGLKDNIVEGESRDYYIDVIIDEAKRMGSLVSDMLDLSQLETGNFKLKIGEFLLGDLMLPLHRKYLKLINEAGLSIELNLNKEIKINGDIYRLDQVMTNFITNAIKNTPKGGKITIKSTENTDSVLIEVINDGKPIAEKDLKNIWEKFYKIDKSRNRQSGGTGLGLAISKNILMLHQSTFGVKNIDGQVDFYFTLKKCGKTIE